MSNFKKIKTMKAKFLYIISLIFCLQTSCSESDLNTTVYNKYTEDNFYKNLGEVNQALTYCYVSLKVQWEDITRHLIMLNDVGSDDCDKGGASLADQPHIEQLESFNIVTSNDYASKIWKICYRGIYRVNTLIDKIEVYREMNPTLSADDDKLLTRYENEARWIRGYFYFNLAYLYGDVPLFLHQEKVENIYKARSPREEVWKQVIADFTAATQLPKRSEYNNEDLGRATSGAAWAMLGRTNWFNRDFAKAKEALAVLVDGELKSEYDLDPDFATQWINKNSNALESVFEIQYKTNGKTWDLSTGWDAIWFMPSIEGGYEFHLPTQQLKDEFDPEDPRITWTFVHQGDHFSGSKDPISTIRGGNRMMDRKHFYSKAESLEQNPPISPNDVRATSYIIRYADVLLMYSESLLESGDLNGAKKNLNRVRKRARESSPLDARRTVQVYVPKTKPTSLPDVTSADPSVVRNAIWRERRCELACEGLRRMDLIQQNRYGQVMTAYYNNTSIAKENPNKGRFYTKEKELLPIPLGDIDKSNGVLIQNPGY